MFKKELNEVVEKKYNIPEFEYWDRVMIMTSEKFPTTNSDAVAASFFEWETWTVIDVWVYDNSINYCVLLDCNLWTKRSDEIDKRVWIRECDLIDEEEGMCSYEDDEGEFEVDIDKCIKEAAEETIADKEASEESKIVARYILNLINKKED